MSSVADNRTDDGAEMMIAVRDLIREMAPIPATTIDPRTRLASELGYDSLGLLELVSAIEDLLGLSPLNEDELADIERVGDLLDLIAKVSPDADGTKRG